MTHRMRLILIVGLGALLMTSSAWRQDGAAGPPPVRDNYFPNTEQLGANEMRVIFAGNWESQLSTVTSLTFVAGGAW